MGNFQTIPSLNGIRAISVLIVVLSHAGYGEIIPGGLGVTIFFFLSGYLITTLLLDEYDRTGSINIRNFYVRRFFRLFPPLLLTLTIAYTLVIFGFIPGGATIYSAIAQIFYLANYYIIYFDIGTSIPAGTVILWSLAVEEHFYIFYPIVLFGLLSLGMRRRTIGHVFAFMCVVVLAWRIYLVMQPSFSEARTNFSTDTRIDSIIFGTLLALWSNPMDKLGERSRMTVFQWGSVAAGISLLISTLLYREVQFRESLRYSLQGIALFPLFYYSVRFHDNLLFRHLNSTAISKIGVWSYSIYLIHFIAIKFVAAQWTAVADRPMVLFLTAAAISICYAIAIDAWLDPYFRRRRQPYLSVEVQSGTVIAAAPPQV
jgi:peptidoglycan/LPS O-acetylase OafA/YrhL